MLALYNSLPDMETFISSEWEVRPCDLKLAQKMVREYHYAKGGSNTAVYVFGLFKKGSDELFGVSWWLPPTRVACESVCKVDWKRVLGLTRLVLLPGVPKNACSFLISKSVKAITHDRRFGHLVTYADESQGHLGTIYRASNWTYVGRTGPYPRWVNSEGVQVACKSTVNRTKSKMEELGHIRTGSFYKHKFVLTLKKLPERSDFA